MMIACAATTMSNDPNWLAQSMQRIAPDLTLKQLQTLRRGVARQYANDSPNSPFSWYHQEFAARAILALDALIAARQQSTDKPNFI